MNIKVPYELIKKGSDVVICGAGEIGQELFWELRSSGYCNLVGIIDDGFNDYDKPPFYKLSSVGMLSFDTVIIASKNHKAIQTLFDKLIECGIAKEKIILGYDFEYSKVSKWIAPNSFCENYEFYNELFGLCKGSESNFAGNSIYQGFDDLGIEGRRNTEERIEAYEIRRLLKRDNSVLDIGCNCGCVDLQIAPYVNYITGIDIDLQMHEMAEKLKKHLKVNNADFICGNFFEEIRSKYDVVCCFAVHKPIIEVGGASENLFIEKVDDLLIDDGLFFFESHPYTATDSLFLKLLDGFIAKGYKQILYKHHYGKKSGNVNRDFTVLQKMRLL